MGSHLTDKLMMDGHEVTVVDNFFTGRKRNVEHWIGHENFELINHDVVEPLYIEGESVKQWCVGLSLQVESDLTLFPLATQLCLCLCLAISMASFWMDKNICYFAAVYD